MGKTRLILEEDGVVMSPFAIDDSATPSPEFIEIAKNYLRKLKRRLSDEIEMVGQVSRKFGIYTLNIKFSFRHIDGDFVVWPTDLEDLDDHISWVAEDIARNLGRRFFLRTEEDEG